LFAEQKAISTRASFVNTTIGGQLIKTVSSLRRLFAAAKPEIVLNSSGFRFAAPCIALISFRRDCGQKVLKVIMGRRFGGKNYP
jgi:hypothetical protein